MPVAPTYPGVYVEEVPSGVHPITGVPTAVAAFVGWFPKGPVNRAVEVLSFGDVEREFGGLHANSDTSFALAQYFINGGARAWVVRVAGAGTGNAALGKAKAVVPTAVSGTDAFAVWARSEGAWGNNLRVQVLGSDGSADERFDLCVSLVTADGGNQVLQQEVYRGLTCTSDTDPNYLVTVVNAASNLVRVARNGASPVATPAATGVLSAGIALTSSQLSAEIPGRALTATLGQAEHAIHLPAVIGSLEAVAAALQSGLRTADGADPRWAQAIVHLVPGSAGHPPRIQVLPGAAESAESAVFRFEDTHAHTATYLKLADSENPTKSRGAIPLEGGGDGAHPGATEIVGSQTGSGSGLFALENTDFTLLCLPTIANSATGVLDPFDSSGYTTVIGNAVTYCQSKRALLLLDPPAASASPTALRSWLVDKNLRSDYSALYYPRLTVADPTRNYQPRSVGPCGTVAGLMARVDGARGVWKAPAGTEATLRGVQKLDYDLTDPENGVLNPIAVNCLRTFPAYGAVTWGARTTAGGDASATDYRYVPVRRLANFLESSLLAGLKWVVFEPNDEPLWSQVRLNIGSFMQGLFRQGAFAGRTPKEAYLVRCDASTTTPDDQAKGVVNVLVGFAPVRPAEFVILQIKQLAGQTQS
ncbi:phage tail sheath C-terminal domain-containing protein [Streptomyces sp. NPDC088921]|uniref:phage tail sheath C-terminal domain-containing protein n=1 Tax=unclassified Streptomyces TaxID=2593676 RepID=UPI0034460FE2